MTPYDWKNHHRLPEDEQTQISKQRNKNNILIGCLGLLPCIKLKYNAQGGIKWFEIFTINHTGEFYLMFNFFVTVCCLVSSYMYVGVAAYRFTDS
jgi:hypothetical protein